MVDDDSRYLDAWTFHQATGLIAAHLDTRDLGEAAMYLIALAARRHESPHDTAVLIVKREIVLGERAGWSSTSVGLRDSDERGGPSPR